MSTTTLLHHRQPAIVRSSPPTMIRRVILGLAMFALPGCSALLGGELNPAYCKAHPDDADCKAKFPDAGIDGASTCTSSADCSPGVCDLAGTMTCVQCTAAEPAACTGATPACVDTRCEACSSHAQCGSGACLPDGSCAEESRVAYVQAGGTGTTCTRAAPCGLLDAGLATNRDIVKMSGLVKDNKTTTISGRAVTILADPGAKLDRDGDGVILEVRNTGADVRIYDLEIGGASGVAGDAGISIPGGGTPKLQLERVIVSGNAGGGVATSAGSLVVSRSVIFGNPGGGIVMSAPGVVIITNNVIHHNGNTLSASAGGLLLRPMGASKLEFNTVIDNQASIGALSAGGVSCDVPGFVGPHNIIFRNTGGPGGTVQTIGVCSYGDSFNMPGASASDNTPQFRSPNAQPFDYHLTAGTPPSIVGAAGACTGVDIDGESRPQGGTCDLGADELTP